MARLRLRRPRRVARHADRNAVDYASPIHPTRHNPATNTFFIRLGVQAVCVSPYYPSQSCALWISSTSTATKGFSRIHSIF
jgi:hypothetical protein